MMKFSLNPVLSVKHYKNSLRLWNIVSKPLEHAYGNMQAVRWNKRSGEVEAASDPRAC